MKKPVIIWTIADENNKKYEQIFKKSLDKFHPNIDYFCLEGGELKSYLKDDPNFFYRATPIISENFIKDYECVIKMDSDQIVTGDLSYIWETKDYDCGTVINYNRIDPQLYGLVAGWGILPVEYFNCGLVSLRSETFIHHWKVLCFTPQFDRLQYKEQDLLNALCYFGNYNIRCFDYADGVAKINAWWGLISKGEWNRAILKDNKIIIPKGLGDTPFPPTDMELKVLHWGGGNSPDKMNYRVRFNEDIIKYLDDLIQ